jgi:hypothetical protein
MVQHMHINKNDTAQGQKLHEHLNRCRKIDTDGKI